MIDWQRVVLVIRVPERLVMDSVSDTYKGIASRWVVSAVAMGVGWLVAHGAVPDAIAPLLQAKATAFAMGVGVLLVGFIQTTRTKLREAALKELPANPDPVAVEITMARLGYRHVLWSVRQAIVDPRYDELRDEVLRLKAQVETLTAAMPPRATP